MRRTAVAFACLPVLLSTVGCALVEKPGRTGPGETSPTATKPASPPSEPTQLPEWFDTSQEHVFAESDVYDAAVVGGTVLTMTLAQVIARSLPDLETSYTVRSPSGGSFVDLFVDEEFVYVLDVLPVEDVGTRAGDQRLAVRRFEASSGSVDLETEVSWRKGVDEAVRPTVSIAAVSGGTVLVQAQTPDSALPPRLIALDLDEGEVAWSMQDTSFVGSVGPTTVVHTADGVGGHVAAIDNDSGEVRWKALEGVSSARLVGLRNDQLTVATGNAALEGTSIWRLVAGSGKVRGTPASVAQDPDWNCLPADPPVVVCSLPDRHGLGYDLDRSAVLWQLPTQTRYGVWVSAVAGDRVYGFTEGSRSVVLDAESGRDVTARAGAAPRSVNGFGGVVLYAGKAIYYPAGRGDQPES